MQLILLKYLLIPFMVAGEVTGILYFYPKCENSFWKLFLLFLGVFILHDTYRFIKNYCSTLY